MEVSDLRKEIEKCLKLTYKNGKIPHVEKYEEDRKTLDELMASYFGMYYNRKTGKYE